FLAEARDKLVPYNVFLAGDVFGYICWNKGDTDVGQKIQDLANVLDYISPMLYPSGFQYGIPKYRDPVAHPYEIVRLSLDRARERTNLDPIRFRPWLQAFRDYAFDRRQFGRAQIQAQIKAADSFGSDGWLLWNPRNVYSAAAIGIKRHPGI
ncbi:MAG: putative glycoside hydrolase, partial [Bryobacteraceae bacterium]